ncbi:MAG: hypothetical protein QXI32_03980 [Candidatus Bathyarchaeia archaeon]
MNIRVHVFKSPLYASRILVSVLIIFSLVLGIFSPCIIVYGRIFSGKVDLGDPRTVSPGGYIVINTWPIPPDAGGGTIYFYLSKNDDAEISSGDALIKTIKRVDVKASTTVKVPTRISAGEYSVKMTDIAKVGSQCLVSDSKLIIVTADLPEVNVNPKSGIVGSEIKVEGKNIGQKYDVAKLYWNDYNRMLGEYVVTDGRFTADLQVPNGFMGPNEILVLLYDSDVDGYFGTYISFNVEPSITIIAPVEPSIMANVMDPQDVIMNCQGFPKGTIGKDTVKYLLKDISTGIIIDTLDSVNEKTAVADTSGFEGTIEAFKTTLKNVGPGVLDIRFQVDTTVFTLKDILLSSKTGQPGEFKAKISTTSGKIGDTVRVVGLNFPAGVAVSVEFEGYITKTFEAGFSDKNGGWTSVISLQDMPGGKYTVRVKDLDNSRHRSVGTFEIYPTVKLPESAGVGDLIDICGEGFLGGSTYNFVEIGGQRISVDIKVGSDGIFDASEIRIPHVSGGGLSVAVKILGYDCDGKPVTVTASIVIEPRAVSLQVLSPSGAWKDYAGQAIFSGTPMRFIGTGFRAKESVKIGLSSSEGVQQYATLISTKSESNGDLEVIFQIPVGSYFSRQNEWTITVAGATKNNRWTGQLWTEDLNNAEAKLYFGLQKDGTLTNEVKEGASITVIGTGFQTSSLVLRFGDQEVKRVTAKYGYFKETIKVPKVGKGAFRLSEDVTGVQSLIVFVGMSAVFLNAPSNTVYFVFTDPTYILGEESTLDLISGGIIYGLCTNTQNLGFNTTSGWILPTGAVNHTTIHGAWVIMVGGPLHHVSVHYYESTGVAPIKYSDNATHHMFLNEAVVASLPKSVVATGHEDMFLIETFTDGDNIFYVLYGFSWKGTFAAGIYFKEVMSRNLKGYNKAFYIFHWVDGPNQDGIPQSPEILEIVSE